MNLIMTDRPVELNARAGKYWEYVDLSEMNIKNCIGCFGCWVKTPGRCVIRDDAVSVYPLIAKSSRVIYVSRVWFGSYDVAVKKMLERAIPVQQAFLRIHEGETHHVQRAVAPKEAVIIAYGCSLASEQAVFAKLVERNAKNMLFKSWKIIFTDESEVSEAVSAAVKDWPVDGKEQSGAFDGNVKLPNSLQPPKAEPLHKEENSGRAAGTKGSEKRRLLIINGSPRAPKSNSKKYIELFHQCWPAKAAVYAVTTQKPGDLWENLHDFSDLLLVFPLYADGLPAILMNFLKAMALAFRQPRQLRLHILVNCGFLEPGQNQTAVEILECFCRKMGWTMGSVLCIGSGEAILSTPFAFLVKRKIRLFARSIQSGRAARLKVSMPLTKKMFVKASERYLLSLGSKNSLSKEQMSAKEIEGGRAELT